MRIFAVSDLHVDYQENASWVDALAQAGHYRNDVLVVAGDVTDDLARLGDTLSQLRRAFRAVAFVPGNHELWVRHDPSGCSLTKFEAVLAMCRQCGVTIEPRRFEAFGRSVWLVPLFSWYALPGEHPSTLFRERPGIADMGLSAWSDTHFVRWPDAVIGRPAQYFAGLNDEVVLRTFDGDVVSFSHFLPRFDVMLSRTPRPKPARPIPFNFSRVAGSTLIDTQLRAIGSHVHVYGHQHRNADRVIEGVRYVSNCLGYVAERQRGWLGSGDLVQVWPPTVIGV